MHSSLQQLQPSASVLEDLIAMSASPARNCKELTFRKRTGISACVAKPDRSWPDRDPTSGVIARAVPLILTSDGG